jgi:cysteinyl-tRNA synthetase
MARGTQSDLTRRQLAFTIAIACAAGCTRRPAATRANGAETTNVAPPESDDTETPAPTQPANAEGVTRENSAATRASTTLGPGFPESGPWVSFYGNAAEMRDLTRVARTFRIINIDADPGTGNFTDAQVTQLKAGGRNRVISYMNLGSCERFRTYWASAPRGLVSCGANTAAQRGTYAGYSEETWMDLGDSNYQALILEHVAPRLAARVDGFYLDNLEIVEHSASSTNGPCSPACRQGGLDLVRKLREKFPNHLIVMQNATSDVTRLGTTGGIPFPLLLDGIAHEEVYAPTRDPSAEAQLIAWTSMRLSTRGRHPFWVGVEDYVGSCANKTAAQAAAARANAYRFSPYVSDESAGQRVVCFWD